MVFNYILVGCPWYHGRLKHANAFLKTILLRGIYFYLFFSQLLNIRLRRKLNRHFFIWNTVYAVKDPLLQSKIYFWFLNGLYRDNETRFSIEEYV